VTAAEAYELTTQGGASDFARVIEACRAFGPYCVIGGLAVNCYAEPVYTLDADIVLVAARLSSLATHLEKQGFRVEKQMHSVNAFAPDSQLRIQFTTDQRYQEFLSQSRDAEILGLTVKVARVEDVAQGKLWAYNDPNRRLSKRKKDELDLIRLAEGYPFLKALYPADLVNQIERG
jgi:hypothetical protein